MGSFNFEMNDGLHKRFKIKTIKEDVTMEETVVALVKKYVGDEE